MNTPVLLAAKQPVEPAFPGKLAVVELEARAARSNPPDRVNSLVVTAVPWRAPLTAQGSRRWNNAWVASAVALAAANEADIASSRNLAKLNPLWRNSQRRLEGHKGALIKDGATGGLLPVEGISRQHDRDGSLDNAIPIVNAVAAGVVGATAGRNYELR
ncbi:MAG: hypothetical protein ACUVXB_04055 [Bryobacteraceae bacterium]